MDAEITEILEEAVGIIEDESNTRVNLHGINVNDDSNEDDDEEDEEDEDGVGDEDQHMGLDQHNEQLTGTSAGGIVADGDTTTPLESEPDPMSMFKLRVTDQDEDKNLDSRFVDNSLPVEFATGTGKVNESLIALGIFATSVDISTAQYTAMVELFQFLVQDPSVFSSIPRHLSTLKKYMRSVLPLQTIKAHKFTPDAEQLPPQSDAPATAYFFDLKEIAAIWQSDPAIFQHLYQGFGEFVDIYSEFWHGDTWLESVRSTSGQFALLPGGTPVIPSNCVWYRHPTHTQFPEFLGLVTGIGYDRRENGTGKLSAAVTPLLCFNQLSPEWKQLYRKSRPHILDGTMCARHIKSQLVSTTREAILMEHITDIVPIDHIIRHESVFFLDYESPQACVDLLPPNPNQTQHSTDRTQTDYMPPKYHVSSILYYTETSMCSTPGIRSVDKRHRLSAENELLHFGRNEIFSPEPIVSLPYTTFLDGFGLYRNSYHSLAGLYITPAALPRERREKLHNVFVHMIGPFGSSEHDISNAIKPDCLRMAHATNIRVLDGTDILYKTTMFCIAHHGDMPQQNKLAGVKSHKAEYGCRGCLVQGSNFGDLSVDVKRMGRYRAPYEHMQETMKALPTKSARDAFAQKHGLSKDGPIFQACHPYLDFIRCTPHNPLHAECRISKYFQICLIEGFGSHGDLAYRLGWEQMELPYQWGRPQNPLTHKGSMNFSEHARIACLNPFILLRVFNAPGNLLRPTVEKNLGDLLNTEDEVPDKRRRIYDNIIFAAYKLATSNFLAFKKELTSNERTMLTQNVLQGRVAFQWVVKGVGGKQLKDKWRVPNCHVPLHYPENVKCFATTRNSACSMGEQKHKVFKQHAPHTNSKENDLQLLQSINLSQTLRYTIDGVYSSNKQYMHISTAVSNVLHACPRLRTNVLGKPPAEKPDLEELSGGAKKATVESEYSPFVYARVGLKLTARTMRQSQDVKRIVECYKAYHHVDLEVVKKWAHRYWSTFTGTSGGERQKMYANRTIIRVSFGDGDPGIPQFALIKRILTVEIGQMNRVMFDIILLRRSAEEEYWAAPYAVYSALDNRGQRIPPALVPIQCIVPGRLHFVTKLPEESWYHNDLLVSMN